MTTHTSRTIDAVHGLLGVHAKAAPPLTVSDGMQRGADGNGMWRLAGGGRGMAPDNALTPAAAERGRVVGTRPSAATKEQAARGNADASMISGMAGMSLPRLPLSTSVLGSHCRRSGAE